MKKKQLTKKRQLSAEFKWRVLDEVNSGELTMTQIAKKYKLHIEQISLWKRLATERKLARARPSKVVKAKPVVAAKAKPAEVVKAKPVVAKPVVDRIPTVKEVSMMANGASLQVLTDLVMGLAKSLQATNSLIAQLTSKREAG